MYKLACSSINYLTLKHLAIWTTPAWCSFHCCSEGCRISSKMVEPPNRDTSSPPEHAQHKWPIRNKAPTKTPSTKNTPSGVNRMVQIWGSSKKNMFCSQCIGKNRDPYFSSISAMLIRVTKIWSAFTTKELRWAVAVVTCAPHQTCTKGGLEPYIDHKRYVVELALKVRSFFAPS